MDSVSINPLISIIIPIHNGENWINSCFKSIMKQTIITNMHIEIAICDDSSTDKTFKLIEKWRKIFLEKSISIKIFKNKTGQPRGVGYAKNRAVEVSSGTYLCFQDIDDVMLPCRIEMQYNIAKDYHNAIVGGRFKRIPDNSTERFTRWANNLTLKQLQSQIYTSHGPTVIMPTWFCHKNVYNKIGGFSEKGIGEPEDLVFFYNHLDNRGIILRTDELILEYLYHPLATTLSIKQQTIFEIRVKRLETKVLPKWFNFTIWNAGKQGRKFYKTLSENFQKKVIAFCDVDKKKIERGYTPYDPLEKTKSFIPVLHFTQAQPPFIICVKLDMTNGVFEENLQSLHLRENLDYVLFN